MVNVYISAPTDAAVYDKAAVKKHIQNLTSSTSTRIKYWGDGLEYDKEFIDATDVLIIMGSRKTFHHAINDLPVGVKREFYKHHAAGKKVLTTYYNSAGWCVYDCTYHEVSNTLMGIAGSSNKLDSIFKTINTIKKDASLANTFDNLSEIKKPCLEIALPKKDSLPECNVNQVRKYSLLLVC
jgi:hypothetical protein